MVEIGGRYRISDIIDMGYYPSGSNSYVNHQEGDKVTTIQNGRMLLIIKKEKV